MLRVLELTLIFQSQGLRFCLPNEPPCHVKDYRRKQHFDIVGVITSSFGGENLNISVSQTCPIGKSKNSFEWTRDTREDEE